MMGMVGVCFKIGWRGGVVWVVVFCGFEEVGWVYGGWIYMILYYLVVMMVGSNFFFVVLIGFFEYGFGIMFV